MSADKETAFPSVSIRVHLRFVFSSADCGFPISDFCFFIADWGARPSRSPWQAFRLALGGGAPPKFSFPRSRPHCVQQKETKETKEDIISITYLQDGFRPFFGKLRNFATPPGFDRQTPVFALTGFDQA
jgi:hypothetical protein